MELILLEEKEFAKFALDHEQATFLQTVNWGKLKKENGWNYELLGCKKNNKIKAATLLLSKATPIRKKMYYAPRGFILDYQDKGLLKEFTELIAQHVKLHQGIFFKIDPYLMYHKRDANGEIIENDVDNSHVVDNLKHLGFKQKCKKKGQQSLQSQWMYWIKLGNRTLDDVMKDMSSKTRQMIRKNEKNGVVIREGKYDDMEEFKRIMDHTSNRREFLSRSLKYYQDMYKAFGNGKNLKLYFADLQIKNTLDTLKEDKERLEEEYEKTKMGIANGKIKMSENKLLAKEEELTRLKERIEEYQILQKKHGNVLVLGAITYFIYGKEVLSFLGGAYEEFMEFQPFYTLHYQMIKYGIEHHYEYYNFYGISSDLTPKDSMYGIYLFKKGFGGEVVELIGEYDYVVNKYYYILYEFSYKVIHSLKKLKTKCHL